MAFFAYKVQNRDEKIISGKVEAISESEAVSILKDKQYKILSIHEASGAGDFLNRINIALAKVKPKDIVSFSRQFAVLISANVSLVQSLKMMITQTENLKLKSVVAEIADEVDGGEKFSYCLAKRPQVFSNFYTNVVSSGESSGKLDEVLNYLADELEKDYDMNAKIKGAMIYPAFVMVMMLGVGTVMMIFVVPKLTDMLAESGGELPIATKLLMAISSFLVNYWYILVISVVGLFFGFRFIYKTKLGKKIIDKVLLHLPIFGNLLQKIYIVRFTRSLQTLIMGGVTISKALGITASVVDNAIYSHIISETKREVEDGNSITTILSESKEIPSMLSQMMKVGEKTGRLDLVLEKITIFYSREINNIVANLMTLMEPIIMVIMGIGVGVMVAAIILPMYQMATSLQ
ncbi:hypothetical protein A2331_02225 [Candidatus Falkowbacteria bacterium RIFOXYB2_FULL_34_18]|uniref:Type II secretion system protein GspF domain-containing protein n=1 Tax=Candidatus Falkowbacteria bacterium RIFOXYD2_FULL_34_120 TaxID=1798007 RepID=A0A1F5TR78_9BACT|nr:MAG: hypothetical protein A2331_02225 [Candidatus Falkowbacteria bacterium RIFOXYB2_FULL_34_18]OGF29516.1 MAG: hypothetical protein A2500_02305 [Candidatus Falkowbacteria bacterium RIFOXYC12_FULL_34_55]OGF36874.1 MAG: hypothetical protein A2466_06665 [Candidatus Falkowbacteria bacterium RIFOXYC2_FULL_34_220]OGF39073.1 MAG: hypothetical protein A2515_04670 [Candidatus Falkowbacteria bacterium RIFOXYD12_FULL_34_57]OGF41274.1 MAG: hypothetical protein A2531_00220 [Candidatus Falkowbacteria bact